MNNRLSYSQLRLYQECGRKYQYHYKDRLREKNRGSALFFGSAFDKATEAVLKNKDADEKKVFDEVFTSQDINGIIVHLPDSLRVLYSLSDFDGDLLLEEDIQFLKAKAQELLPLLYQSLEGDVNLIYEVAVNGKKQQKYRTWSEASNKFFNLCCWLSMRRKGHMMLDAHRQYILPRFVSIIDAQKKIELQNDLGDTLVGYIDCIAVWEDNRTIIFDYKTSKIKYPVDSVIKSPQLGIYSIAESIKTCGYIVFGKNIIKNKTKICSLCSFNGSATSHKTCNNLINKIRCNGKWNETIHPSVSIDIIIDEIPEILQDLILEQLQESNGKIHSGVFEKNLDSCKTVYGMCPYYNKCHGDGSDTGLEKV